MSQILEFCTMSSQVITYDDLQHHMSMDVEDKNEYYMNQNMVKKYFESVGLVLNPSLYLSDYYKLQVYGRTIHMMKEFPDNEVLVVNKHHPHWFRT